MTRRARIFVIALIACALPPFAIAQQSASYKLREWVLNEGGNPIGGAVLASASFRVRLDSIGDGARGDGLAGTSYRVDSGFVSAYTPPGETLGLAFTAPSTLVWTPERSTGTYNVYRDVLTALPTGTTGACFQPDLASESTLDVNVPDAETGYFYLVTAKNRVGEEGTKGFRSGGVERPNPATCP